MTDYIKKDAAKETGSGGKETSRAWHQAREDAQSSDHPVDKELAKDWGRTPDSKTSDSSKGESKGSDSKGSESKGSGENDTGKK